MLNSILVLVSVLIMMMLMKRIVKVFPYLSACIMRSKESINLETDVKLSRTRDIIAMAMFIPFCLMVYNFHLYGKGILDTLVPDIRLSAIIAIFLFYILFRKVVFWLFKSQKIPKQIYLTAEKASYTFFIILNIALFITGGLMNLIEADPEATKNTMLWLSALIYTLFIIRKTEIFISSCSVFTAFLYLCALEIIPTGTLMVSLIIF